MYTPPDPSHARRTRMAALVALAAAMSMGGCEPDAPGEPDAQVIPDSCLGDIAPEDAFSCAVASICAVYAPCFGDALSGADCRALDPAFFDLFGLDTSHGAAVLTNALAAGTLAYDGQEMARCLADVRALSCQDIFASTRAPFGTCRAFVGTVATGDDCVRDLECAAPGAYCERTACTDGDVCCPGQCADSRPIDGLCARDIECGDGGHCVDGLCADGQVGARCVEDSHCALDNHCQAGACVADRASGTGCERDAQCQAPNSCVGRNLPTGGTCARSLMTGDPCSINCRSFPSHYCDQPDPTALGICRARVVEGTACTSQVMPCQIHMSCDQTSRTCSPSGQVGDECESSIQCQFFRDLYCSTELAPGTPGTCMARQPDGANCTDDAHCLSGLCRGDLCAPVEGCY